MDVEQGRGDEILQVTRGRQVESVHYGHVAVVDGEGELVAWAGDPLFITFWRSCAKFHQALPVILSGAADRFGFIESELAITCASHEGEEFHLAQVRSILSKVGLDESALKCGVHAPSSAHAAAELIRVGKQPTAIHNNCSGKHAGMLAVAVQMGAPIENYIDEAHPVQQMIMDLVGKFSGASDLSAAIDGCSVPTFAMTVRDMACAFARFANPAGSGNSHLEHACHRIWEAVVNFPQLISNRGGVDCEIIRPCAGRVLAKIGAEALFCLAVRPSGRWPHGLGIALKIEDGTGVRARAPVAIEILRQLSVVDATEAAVLGNLFPSEVRNRVGTAVGKMTATVQLNFMA